MASGIRILFVIIIGFLSTRLLLDRIGFVDYGILTALGATALLTSIFVTGLTNAAQRHITFEIGSNNNSGAIRVHSSSLAVFATLSILTIFVGFLIKPLVFHLLHVPPERLEAAKLVYLAMIVQWMLAAITAPCRALIYAHQHIVSASIFGLNQKILQLLIIVLLYFLKGDQLVLYIYLLLAVTVISSCSLVVFTLVRYRGVRPASSAVNGHDCRRLIAFGSWSLLSILVYQLRQQGAVFAINVFFGPAVNAAYAIATTINNYLHQTSGIVHSALQPVVTTAYAQNREREFSLLISAGSRYTYYSALFVFIPLVIEIPFFLEFWLGEYPPGSVEFTRLVALASILGYMTNGYGLAIVATDQMRSFVLVSSGIQLIFFTLGVSVLQIFGLGAWALPASMVVGSILQCFLIPTIFGRALGYPISVWLRDILLPCVFVTLAGGLAGVAAHGLIGYDMLRFISVILIVGSALCGSIFLVGMTGDEKRLIKTFLITGLGFLGRRNN